MNDPTGDTPVTGYRDAIRSTRDGEMPPQLIGDVYRERLATQAATIEEQRETITRLERQVKGGSDMEMRLDGLRLAVVTRSEERDAALARAEASEQERDDWHRLADERSAAHHEALAWGEAAEAQAAALRLELQRQVDRCPNCHGEGKS